jgi:hypothetical protein
MAWYPAVVVAVKAASSNRKHFLVSYSFGLIMLFS